MKRILALSFLFVLVLNAGAQQGYPLLTNFSESRDIENQSWAICQDESQVMLFANRKGILTFDGQEWRQANVPVIPYAMHKNPSDGRVYVGGENNFGYVEPGSNGEYNYISLSGDSIGTGTISRIVFNDSLIWFCSDIAISRYDLTAKKCNLVIRAKPGFPFTGMIINPKNTFINVYSEGLYRLESDTLFPIVTGYLTEDVDILFSLPYDNSLVLVGQSNGKLYLFDGIKYYDYQIKDEGYLKANVLSDCIMLGDTAYAFSTLDGGALIAEKKTGKVLYTINNQVELPDDEIFAMGIDRSGGIWLSHQYGLTRADLKLPVARFSTYPGLTGNLSSAIQVNGQLYVATSEGLFYLDEVRNYQEAQVLVKKETAATPVTPVAGTQEKQTARKSIFSKIFGGRSTETAKQEEASVQVTPAKPSVEYTKKTVSTLRSINHIYRKIPGLNEKCRQIVSSPGGILVATNKGLFVVNEKQARIVVPDRYINSISWNPVDGKYLVAAGDGYFSVSYSYGKWLTETPDPTFTQPVYSLAIDKGRNIWLGSDNSVFRSAGSAGKFGPEYKSYAVKNEFPQRYNIAIIDDIVYLFTESGVYTYSDSGDNFVAAEALSRGTSADKPLSRPLSDIPVFRSGSSWISPGSAKLLTDTELSMFRVFDEVVSVTTAQNYIWIVNGENKLFRIDRKRVKENGEQVEVIVKNISNDKGIRFGSDNIKFDRGDDIVIFDIVSPSFLEQNTTQYQYYISRNMPGWSDWSDKTHYEKVITKPGEYKLQVRAKDLWGNVGESEPVTFKIRAPFTETLVFYILVAGVLLAVLITVVRFREKQMKEQNRLLEEKVRERTAEVVAQKEEITASIEYASRIQRAMLPVDDHFRSAFSEYFVLFKPRDIVSGDFYWIGEDQKSVFFTVADCTGHGVPGAFMSAMGISTLNELIANYDDLKASKVLDLLRQKIKTSLHQTGKEGEAVDGMDIALCVLSSDRKTIQFAGAYNSVLLVSNNEVSEYKGNSMPIGIHYGEEEPFTNHEIKVKKGDSLYLFSDGFPDQFGGPDGTKYKKANLKKLIGEVSSRPMSEQQQILEKELSDWKGDGFQIDDITIMGVRI